MSDGALWGWVIPRGTFVLKGNGPERGWPQQPAGRRACYLPCGNTARPNGALAGLAAITAGTAYVTPAGAVIIGGVAGVLVVLAVGFFDRVRADDPVGAIAVHGVNGTWGALAVGLFAEKGGLFYGGGLHLLGVQALGVLAVSLWAFTATGLVFYLLKKTVGIRVPASEELEGLDINEHGIPAYAGLVAGSLGEVGVDEFAPDTTCAPEVVSRAAVQK
ncbi:ammonium transporter [Desulfofundulus salinus]|uniref:ammonium transporter n=1 Tax=Desulfofundulus salinus TaxID=2419843 RepID=UPI001FAA7196|nr:hypothetical protein [Desulfofundulus salinum]